VVFAVAGTLGWLFVGRVLSGLSAGIVTGTATATIVDLVPQRSKARASLVAAAVNMGGLGAGPLLAGVLAQYAPLPLMLCSIVDLALVVVAALAVQAVIEPVPRAHALRFDHRRSMCRSRFVAYSPSQQLPGSLDSRCWAYSLRYRQRLSARCCTTLITRSPAR
jgi:MFS family permease